MPFFKHGAGNTLHTYFMHSHWSLLSILFIAAPLVCVPKGYCDRDTKVPGTMLRQHRELIDQYFASNGIVYSSRRDGFPDLLSSLPAKCSGRFDSNAIESIINIKVTRSHIWYRVTCAGFMKCDNTLTHTFWQVVIGLNDNSINVKELNND